MLSTQLNHKEKMSANLLPTVFSVIDTETCLPLEGQKKGRVFDIGWQNIDRKGNIYNRGSYLAKDVLSVYRPYYQEKVSNYFDMAFENKIIPLLFPQISDVYNHQVATLKSRGHRVIVAAYNASFDFSVLKATAQEVGLSSFMQQKIEVMCIWYAWALSCPKNYAAGKTASGKFVKTDAESVYRWEFNEPSFSHKHTGFADVEAETKILLKILRRKKKLPVFNNPSEIPGNVYKIANERLR